MADEYKYDAFISYSHKDEDWVVNTLLPALENAKVKVCIDFRDFTRGAPSVKEIENAILLSRKTLMVLSPDYLASKWTDFEVTLGQTLSPANQDLRLLPLLREKCDLPLRISYMTYIDFVRKDREGLAWKQLFTALGKPDAPIPITAEPAKSETEVSPNWHLAHPYPMPPSFTGRLTERKMLVDWLQRDTENRLFILIALGGFGKSALSWYWLTHDVSAKNWPKVVWWSFYEGDASFEHFIKETLEYLEVEVPPGQRTQVDELLKALSSQKVLLIMDGFERALRAYSSMNAAYQGDSELPSPLGGGAGGGVKGEGENQRDCVNLNAEIFLKNLCVLPNIKGKVLMTTRLTPRAVEQRGELLGGCHEEELKAMQKEDAVAFFRAQGIRGARAEIEAVCEPYGYHPLSLRILAGLIANDREAPGDIAVAGKLDITEDVVQNKHHVLEVAYNTLAPEQQKLLSHIACFRSAMSYDALKAISDENIDADLKTLEHRGLLHWDKATNKYDLHPIVRRYAYDKLTGSDRTSAHERLVNYFEAVPKPNNVNTLEDLAPVIELYHHMVRAGNLDEAVILLHERLSPNPLFFQFGAYQLQIELLRALFLDGEDKPLPLKDERAKTWTLNELSVAYSMNGQLRRAVPLFLMSNEFDKKSGNKKGVAIGLGNVAQIQLVIGALSAAERNSRRSIDLCREIADEGLGAVGQQELGRMLSYRGAWQEAEQELLKSQKVFDEIGIGRTNFGSSNWAYRSLRCLLLSRTEDQKNINLSIEFANQALKLAEEHSMRRAPYPRDYIRAYWLLGAAYCANNDLTLAEENLSKALNLCRQINLVEVEADILLELAKLRYAQEKPEEAKSLAEEALLITERSGYVLQGADVNLFLAQFALEQEKDKEKAKELAERAKELATCDGPPYYYKVAYEEAERFLEVLNKK
jgi:tetratricopeptide (TPR) repeat protein